MIKKFFLAVLVFIVIGAAAIFIYRYQIVQYSTETIIRKLLPDYIIVGKINFDFKKAIVTLNDFRIKNAPGFSDEYLLEIGSVSCKYKMKGSNILDGLEIAEPLFRRPTLNIERLKDGRVNINEMDRVVGAAPKPSAPKADEKEAKAPSKVIGNKTLADVLRLPERFTMKDGRAVFLDRSVSSKPHLITFENVDAVLTLRLDSSYTKALGVSSKGQGNLNGNREEVIKWDVSMNPTTPKLTMSNRFDVSNVDILALEPYYDKYSPFVFKKGKFSGTLVFDFDNGNIGSTNEVHISDFQFYIKRGYENAKFWETTVPDLAKYFTSPFGEIVFDFKIKGDMSNPQFYLGPISKQALVSMAVDKVSEMLENAQKQGAPGQGPKTDLDKAKDYIDLFKGMINKK